MNETYVADKTTAFKNYLGSEIAILEQPEITDAIAYTFLKTLIQRLTAFVEANTPASAPKELVTQVLPEHVSQLTTDRQTYLTEVAETITQYAQRYEPEDGSFWEDVKCRLTTLSEVIAKQVRQEKADQLELEAQSLRAV